MGLGPWPLGRSIRGESGGRPGILLSRPEKQSSCEHWMVWSCWSVPLSCWWNWWYDTKMDTAIHNNLNFHIWKRTSSNQTMEASKTCLSQMYLPYQPIKVVYIMTYSWSKQPHCVQFLLWKYFYLIVVCIMVVCDRVHYPHHIFSKWSYIHCSKQ